MGQTLTNGIYLPDEGERNSYSGLEANWRTLDALILTVNGKAAPNVANTWTAAQTFTAGITGDLTGNVTGNLTGTASRAIADEDGTSIKTGYGKLAGNQTWTGVNTFTQNLRYRLDINGGQGNLSETKNYVFLNELSTDDKSFSYDLISIAAGFTQLARYARVYDSTGTQIQSDATLYRLNSNGTSFFAPRTTNVTGLGTATNQWSSVYAQTYYYNGVAWGLDKANEWAENNIFSKRSDPASVTSIADTTLAFNGLLNTIFLNTRGSSNRRSYGSFLFVGYGSSSGADNYGQIQLLRSTDKRGDTNDGYVPDTSFKMWRVAPHSLIMDSMEAVRVTNDGTENSLKPITNNATDLGTSTNKWKTLNGINPGALSLPARDYVSSMDVDTTDWDLTGTTFYYTPIIDGWLQISVSPNNNYAYIAVEYATLRNNCENTTGRNAMLTVPVVANKRYDITIIGSTIAQARLAPAQGNV